MNLTQCKIIFHFGSVSSQDQVNEVIKKYTDQFSVATFYPDRQIGSNRTTFAVVNVPQELIPKIMQDELVKDIDLMGFTSALGQKDAGACCSASPC